VNPRIPKTTKRFRRDYKRIARSGKKIEKLNVVMQMLTRGILLPTHYKDHLLQGELQNRRDCHIEGDWLLLYQLTRNEQGEEVIIFHATDTHENIFG